jgi:hypothetical protein
MLALVPQAAVSPMSTATPMRSAAATDIRTPRCPAATISILPG